VFAHDGSCSVEETTYFGYLQWAVVLVVALLAVIGWAVYGSIRGRIEPYEEDVS
jgi:hypothetical protein